MSQYLVYKLTSPNGKSYIGCTKNYKRRFYNHKHNITNKELKNDIEKFGWDNFTKEILVYELTKKEAYDWEIFYIYHFKTIYPNGFNYQSGGDKKYLGKKHSESHKQYMSDKLTGRKYSSETIEKMSESQIKKMADPEYKSKCSKGFFKKGHIKTEAHRLAISEAAKKRWQEFRRNKDV